MHFIAQLRRLSGGKPTGFKLCVGHPWEFFALVKAMIETGITPDFIVVDGSEGGTGAAPLEFIDHMGMPLRDGLVFVHSALVGAGLRDRIKLGASGKITSAFDMARAMALGADWCNSARGFMFAVGCIQAQTCHTGHCPTGVATQDRTRQRAIVVADIARSELPQGNAEGAGRAHCGGRADASRSATTASLHAPRRARPRRHFRGAVSVPRTRRTAARDAERASGSGLADGKRSELRCGRRSLATDHAGSGRVGQRSLASRRRTKFVRSCLPLPLVSRETASISRPTYHDAPIASAIVALERRVRRETMQLMMVAFRAAMTRPGELAKPRPAADQPQAKNER
jgi:hypothetical protein